MTIEQKTENGSLVLHVGGELTALTAKQLSSAAKAAITETSHLVLDFKDLEYVASAGLRVLLEARDLLNKKHGKLTIRNISKAVMQIFDITGFSDILDLE